MAISKAISNLGFAETGNILLAGTFLQALLSPNLHIDFIIKTSLLIFVLELLAIHSNAIAIIFNYILGGNLKIIFGNILQPGKFVMIPSLLAFYASIALSWGSHLGNSILPAYFVASLSAKFFGAKSAPSESRVSIMTWLFLLSFFGSAISACFWQNMFPFSAEIYGEFRSVWTITGTGACLNSPQYWLVWGVLYYTSISILEGVLFLKRKQN